jgi:hypothetical protein
MPVPTAELTRRWKTGKHVGPAKPSCLVRIQRGVIDHAYQPFEFLGGGTENFGYIEGSAHSAAPWQGFWRATGDWLELPNVKSVERTKTLDENGVGRVTVGIENVIYQAIVGVTGIYHGMRRGFLAPWFGLSTIGRPASDEQLNEWTNVLNGGYRIEVHEGYGDEMQRTFVGLIDDTDAVSTPATITLTCRDFGQTLTDQRVFGWNKAREIKSPITFADASYKYKESKVSSGAEASSTRAGHPVVNVTKQDSSRWVSQFHNDPGVTEWVQVRLSAGVYEEFYLDPAYPGLETYLCVYAHGDDCTIDGEHLDAGWVAVGEGLVPGDNGGNPFIRKWNGSSEGLKRSLGHKLKLGDNSILRIAFRNLYDDPDISGYDVHVYVAGARRLLGYKRTLDPDKKTKGWIFVNDGSDVVKWAYMWAGFHEWEVESFGAPLAHPIVFHQGNYLVDIVKHMEQDGAFAHFMGQPSEDEDSIGVPTFRATRALASPQPGMIEIRDKDLLTGLQTKFTKENLGYVLRARGKEKKGEGVWLGEDLTERFQATYFPPWSGAHHSLLTGEYDHNLVGIDRLAGMRKHVVHADVNLASEDECMMACLLIAVQQALTAFTGTATLPGYPGLELDEQLSIIDSATGTNTRMWINSITSTFTAGEDASYLTSVGGVMIDTPDLVLLAVDYLYLLSILASRE